MFVAQKDMNAFEYTIGAQPQIVFLISSIFNRLEKEYRYYSRDFKNPC